MRSRLDDSIPSKRNNQQHNKRGGNKKKGVDSRQFAELNHLRQRVNDLERRKSSGGKKRHAGGGTKGSTKMSLSNPLHASVVAQFKPDGVPRGIVSHLEESRPSQKFTARAVAQVSLTANQSLVGAITPCTANDTTQQYSSVTMRAGLYNTAGIYNLNGADSFMFCTDATNWTVATGAVRTNMYTNTPYPNSAWDGTATCRLVSAVLKVKFSGSALNTSGTLLSFVDNRGIMCGANDLEGQSGQLTVSQFMDKMNANHNVVRREMVKGKTIDIVIRGDPTWSTSAQVPSNPSNTRQCSIMAGSSAPVQRSPHAYFMYTESSGSSTGVSLDFELIEHWEFISDDTQILQTDSVAHPTLSHTIMNLAASAHSEHAVGSHHISFADVVKRVAKTQKDKRVQGAEEDMLMGALTLI